MPVGGGAWPDNTQSPRPIGGRREACGAWQGFEATRRAKLAARTAEAGGQAARRPKRAGRPRGGRRSVGATNNKQEDRRPPAHTAERPKIPARQAKPHWGSREPGCGARGRWRGPAGLRADAPSYTTAPQPHWCGGRPRDRGQAAVPVGGGWAWPGFEPTRQATRQHTRPHWREGPRRDWWAWLRCPWAAAWPGRASRSITPSRRLACGDLAGGPPPTGTPRSPARQRIQKRPPGTGWAYLSRLWESNPRPIHYE